MNSKKRTPRIVGGLFDQFITYLISPRKKQVRVEKTVRVDRYSHPHQNKREKLRRIRQGLAGLNC